MTTDTLSSLAPAGSALGTLSSQQLQTLVGQVREQLPAPSFDSDEGLKDSLVGRAEPMAQGVVSALGLASIALLSEARAEQTLANLSPLRLALDSLDSTFLSTEPQLMALLGPNAVGELGALRGDVAALDWIELLSMVQDLSGSLSSEALLSAPGFTEDADALPPIAEGLSAILADLPLLEQAGQALPGLEATLADAGVSVPEMLASGDLVGVTLPPLTDPLALVSGVTDLTQGVVDAVSGLTQDLVGVVDDTVDVALGLINDSTDAVLDAVGDVAGGLTDAVENLLGGDEGALGGLTETTQELIDGLDGLVDGAVNVVGDTADSLIELIDGTGDLVGDTLDGLLSLGSDPTDSVTSTPLDLGGEDLLGLVGDLFDADPALLQDTTTTVTDVLVGGAEGGPIELLTDVGGATEDVLVTTVDTLGGDGGLLGSLTEPLVSSGTEEGLLGLGDSNLLG